MSNLQTLINQIRDNFQNSKFDRFIHEINFPKFKNFAPDSKIIFYFPVTVVIGPNGGGKSSILQAAWGMPVKYSTSRFWFSTPVDPIDFGAGRQNRYWYSHYIKAMDLIVQCRKMSGRKRHGYWEPTRPAQKERMSKMPQKTHLNQGYMSDTGDRWNQVDRTPHYINSKNDSSAFERYFYSIENSTLEKRQDNFVKYSRQLKIAIDQQRQKLSYYRVERLKENFEISDKNLKTINNILQKNYLSARYINHSLYDRNFSGSVIFETEQRSYSECFAGSGELAVVNYILSLNKVKKYDLVLLDEPETSLHPGAQARLLEYILGIVKEKLLQVIISSHSPTFVDLLPVEALVVLDESPHGITIRSKPTKASAFHRLGHIEKDKITIVTEDVLLETLVKRALKYIPKELTRKIVVIGAEVGASEMLSNQARAYAQTNANVLMVLDGDQLDIKTIIDLDPASLSEKSTKEHIGYLKDNNVSIVGTRQDLTTWINWCKKHVAFINEVCPEAIFLQLLNPNHQLLSNPKATNSKFKDSVRDELHKIGTDRTSQAQAVLFSFLLGKETTGSNVDLKVQALAAELLEKANMLEKD